MFNKKFVVSRHQLADDLKQFAEKEHFDKTYSLADLDFMKTTLLPIKAKLIQGTQLYNRKDTNYITDNIFDCANLCLECLQHGHLGSAYEQFMCFFDFGIHDVCSYSELAIGVLLVNSILDACNYRIEEYSNLLKKSQFSEGKEALECAVTETESKFAFDTLESELRWYSKHPDIGSFQLYFGLSDKEYKFIHNSCLKAFKVIVDSRRKGVDILRTKQTSNFIEQVVQGITSISEIDDKVEFWHKHNTGNSLEDFLGLTKEEFELWTKSDNDILNDIVFCRKNNLAISKYIRMKSIK